MNIHMADTACTPCTWVQIIHMMHICMQYIQYSCSRRAEGRKEWEKGGKREGRNEERKEIVGEGMRKRRKEERKEIGKEGMRKRRK